MNLILQLLAAAALIAVMASLRAFAGRSVTQHRLKCDGGDEHCGASECFAGCSGQKTEMAEE